MATKTKQQTLHLSSPLTNVDLLVEVDVRTAKSSNQPVVQKPRLQKPVGTAVVKALKGEEAFEAARAAGIFTAKGRLTAAYS